MSNKNGCTPWFTLQYCCASLVEQVKVVSPIVSYLFAFAFFTEGGIHDVGSLILGLVSVVFGLALFLEGYATTSISSF